MRENRRPIFDQVEHLKFLTPAWMAVRQAFYCRHCIDPSYQGGGFGGPEGIRKHLRLAHGYAEDEWLTEGEHFFRGDQLNRLLVEWFTDNEMEILRAHKQLASIVTVDDFLVDCG